MLYTIRFFSSKCDLFHNANLFGSCIIHILYTECAKIKKNNSGVKALTKLEFSRQIVEKKKKTTASNVPIVATDVTTSLSLTGNRDWVLCIEYEVFI